MAENLKLNYLEKLKKTSSGTKLKRADIMMKVNCFDPYLIQMADGGEEN